MKIEEIVKKYIEKYPYLKRAGERALETGSKGDRLHFSNEALYQEPPKGLKGWDIAQLPDWHNKFWKPKTKALATSTVQVRGHYTAEEEEADFI